VIKSEKNNGSKGGNVMRKYIRRAAALSLGLLLMAGAFGGCTGVRTDDPTTPGTTASGIPQTTIPFGKDDPSLPATGPVQSNTEDVTQLRLYNMRNGWTEAFRTENGMFLAADSVQALMSGLSDRGIPVEKLDLSDYDDRFFAENILVVIPRTSNSGSVRYSARVEQSEAGITISTVGKMPEIGTSDMADWLVLVPLDRSLYTGPIHVEGGTKLPSNIQRYAIHRF
jgi:hypothetical protein